jgi:iron(III) transport system substrate-binding protein
MVMRRRGSRGGALAIAALAVLGLVAAACGGDEPAATSATGGATEGTAGGTAAAADEKPSGTITIYSGRAEALVKPILDEFAAETGVKVEFRAGDSGELGAQILTEAKASPADVFFSQDAGALGAVTKAKLLAPLPKDVLDDVDPAYRAKDGTWVGVSGRLRVVVYNPELAPDPPDTIDALLAPQWQGKIGFAPNNASWQSFVTALRIVRGDDGAKRWLEGFAAQQPKAYEKNGVVRDAVDDGEVALGLVNHYYLYEKIAKEGAAAVTARNHYLAPGDPGGLLNVAGVGVLASSDNKTAANALVRFLLSEKGQRYFSEKTFEYPLAGGVEQAEELPALASLKPPAIDLSDLDTLARTQELLAGAGLLTK